MSEDEVKFLPCPFCGGKDMGATNDLPLENPNWMVVECLDSGCQGAGPLGLGIEEATKKWNKRMPIGDIKK